MAFALSTARAFARDESGATSIEYVLIAAIIFLGILGSVTLLSDTNNGAYADTMNRAAEAMNTAGSGGEGSE